MKIVTRPIASIEPYDKNPRKNDAGVDAVAASLKEFGFQQPIVVDKQGIIVVGHTRYKAALKLGLKDVPVLVATALTDEQIRAYRIADNKTNEYSEWDYSLLPFELAALQEADYDLDLLGFSENEIAEIMDPGVSEGQTDPDSIPQMPDDAITKPGDLWLLGNHRLLCGDSWKADQVDLLMGGKPVHLVHTDPPYNVKNEPRSNNAIVSGMSSFPLADSKAKNGKSSSAKRPIAGSKATHSQLRAKDRPISNDAMTDEAFDEMLDAWFGNMSRVLIPGRGFYIWGGYANLGNYPPFLKKHELYFAQGIIWDKEHPVIGRKDFMNAFEICYYGWKLGAGHTYLGPANATDLWHVKKLNHTEMVHLTQKPTELAIRALQYSSRMGENILDLFGGSGMTLIAAEQTGRNAFLMELDMLYCDVIVKRWEEFTGRKAECVSAQAARALQEYEETTVPA